MATVTLTLDTNIQALIDALDKAGIKTSELEDAVKAYGQKSSEVNEKRQKELTKVNELIDKNVAALKRAEDTEKRLNALRESSGKLKPGQDESLIYAQKSAQKYREELAKLIVKKNELANATDDLGKKTTKLDSFYSKLGATIGAAFTSYAIIGFAKNSVAAFDEAEKAASKLLVAIGGRKDIQDRLIQQAKELQKSTRFADDEVIEAQARLGRLLGDNEEAIKKLTPLIADFATAQNMDLASAADLVGKAFGSSTNALGRYGIKLNENVGSAERLEEIVSKLNEQVGGQARAAANTGTGALIQLKNAWNDIQEVVGGFLSRAILPTIKGLKDMITPAKGVAQAYSEMIDKTEQYQRVILPLTEEYTKLSEKTSLNKDEHDRLKIVIDSIADVMPSAITSWDEYGNAQGVSAEKVNANYQAHLLLQGEMNKNTIQKFEKDLEGVNIQIQDLTKELNTGERRFLTLDERGRAITQTFKLSEEQLQENRERIKELQSRIPGLTAAINKLKGIIDKPIDVSKAAQEWVDVEKATINELIAERTKLTDKYGDLITTGNDFEDEANKDRLALLNKEIKFRQEAYELMIKDQEEAFKKMEANLREFEKIMEDSSVWKGVSNEGDFEKMQKLTEDNVKDFEKWANDTAKIFGQISWQEDTERLLKEQEEFNKKLIKNAEEIQKWKDDNPFWASLGLENDDQVNIIKDSVSEIISVISDLLDAQVDANERIVDDLNTRIEEQSDLVEREYEDKKEGLANNYELESQALKDMQTQRDAAIKEREKSITLQRTLSAIESGIALVSASANIIKGFSSIPVVGWLIIGFIYHG